MIDKTELIPERIPEALRIAAVRKKLIPFIGAGVSQLGAVRTGLNLRTGLYISLFKKKYKKEIGKKLYANLSRLATTFVTTNYDEWLDQSPPSSFYSDGQASSSNLPEIARQPFYKRKDITVENLDVSNAVFHIHGSIRDRAFSLIKILLENLEAVDEPGKDAIFQAINSSRGKTIEVFFSHTLRVCRIDDEANGSHAEAWDKIKPVFDAEIDDLRDVGRLFYNVRDQELNPEQIERILLFWEQCVKWAETLSEPSKSLLSDLSRLICYITEFTDRANNLLPLEKAFTNLRHLPVEG